MATFTNIATLTYNGNVTTSNTVTGTLQEILSAAKAALLPNYSTNTRVTYAISLVNSSTRPLQGLTITDDLGAYTFGQETVYPLEYTTGSIAYYVNGVKQAAPTVTATQPLTITGINVPARGNAMLLYEAVTNEFAPVVNGSSIENTATIEGGGLVDAVTADATITAAEGPILTISKCLDPAVVPDNGELTYTFIIQNSGNLPATVSTGAFITDTFDPPLDPISVTFNGTPWVQGVNYTYEDGVFTSIAGQITVPVARFSRDPQTGAWIVIPGTSTLVVTGTI